MTNIPFRLLESFLANTSPLHLLKQHKPEKRNRGRHFLNVFTSPNTRPSFRQNKSRLPQHPAEESGFYLAPKLQRYPTLHPPEHLFINHYEFGFSTVSTRDMSIFLIKLLPRSPLSMVIEKCTTHGKSVGSTKMTR